jgi:hypothetical protein
MTTLLKITKIEYRPDGFVITVEIKNKQGDKKEYKFFIPFPWPNPISPSTQNAMQAIFITESEKPRFVSNNCWLNEEEVKREAYSYFYNELKKELNQLAKDIKIALEPFLKALKSSMAQSFPHAHAGSAIPNIPNGSMINENQGTKLNHRMNTNTITYNNFLNSNSNYLGSTFM